MKTILVIDDDKNLTSLLCRLLNNRGVTAIASNSGMEGIRMVREHAPSVVILDLMMPEMDGFQVCEQIRQFSNIHILVMSAICEPRLVSRALLAGADHFLAKPTPITTLIAYLSSLSLSQEVSEPALYSF